MEGCVVGLQGCWLPAIPQSYILHIHSFIYARACFCQVQGIVGGDGGGKLTRSTAAACRPRTRNHGLRRGGPANAAGEPIHHCCPRWVQCPLGVALTNSLAICFFVCLLFVTAPPKTPVAGMTLVVRAHLTKHAPESTGPLLSEHCQRSVHWVQRLLRRCLDGGGRGFDGGVGL